MPSPVSELIELLTLERLEDNLFRGQSRDIGTKYVFGGQVLGQALSAAQATLEVATRARAFAARVFPARRRHRAADRLPGRPHPRRRQLLGAARDRDPARASRSSSSPRRSRSTKHGGEHQLSMPEVPKPEDIEPSPDLARRSAREAADQGAALAVADGAVRIPPRLSARRTQSAQAPAVPAGVVPPVRTRRRRAGTASRAARLRIGLPPARHRDLSARHQLLPAERADGLARPCAVVPPPVPRRRMAAVFDRQPERAGRRAAWRAA